MKRYILGVFFLSLVLPAMLFAQPASATWALSADQSVTAVSGNITANVQTAAGFTLAYEAPASLDGNTNTTIKTQKNKPDASTSGSAGNGSWPAEASYNPNRYVQFSVSPKATMNFTASSISLYLGAKGVSTLCAGIYYSTDPAFTTSTLIGEYPNLPSNAAVTVTYSFSAYVPDGQTLYIRVYAWSPTEITSTTKYLFIGNVTISGTTEGIPLPASAQWELLSSESATVNGLISATNVRYAGGLYRYGYNTNGCRWTIDNGPSGKGSWPQETSPNFSRYAQVAISPLAGGTFVSDSLSFTQVVEFTNNLRLAVYVAKDTSFTQAQFVADTAVPSSKTTYNYKLIPDTIETGETLYVRFYPYNINGDPAWKLVDMSNIVVTGYTTGIAIQPPTVTTKSASYISTTFLTTGGNVTADGGGAVTERGVCWNTTGAPTINDAKVASGTGTGAFTVRVTALTPNVTYYLRAYAVNAGGVGYGNEITFTTLAEIVPPTVTTNAVTNIMAVTATGGGSVTDWGGDTVTAKGICWNTTGSPTIADSKTIDGQDVGPFSSALSGLQPSTTYYVRAYAINKAGVGYGTEVSFTTQTPQPDTVVIVAQDGSGDYTTLQAAFRAVPVNYTGKWTIFVKKGIYYEKDTLAAGKVNVTLIGEDRDSTIITYDDYGDRYGSGNPGTSGSFTITIDASDFTAKNITFRNTYYPLPGASGTQAVALRTQGDRHQYINCRITGYQDTYYTWGGSGTGRMYHKNCIIEGTVDFIFGRNICVFDSCTIIVKRNGGTVTAAATDATSKYGYVFRNCTITHIDTLGYDGAPVTSYYLGRPWQNSPRTVFIHSYESSALHSAGWLSWNVAPGLYAEYNCFGPGANTDARASFSRQLTNEEASMYSLETIFARASATSNLILYDWYPSEATANDNIPFPVLSVESSSETMVPHTLTLANYPNPFNPATVIRFTVPASGRAVVKVYNLLGQEVCTLLDDITETGTYYTVHFDGTHLASGVYLYTLESNGQRKVNRMLLLK